MISTLRTKFSWISCSPRHTQILEKNGLSKSFNYDMQTLIDYCTARKSRVVSVEK